MNNLKIDGQLVKTVGDIFCIGGFVLYFVDQNGVEVEDDEVSMPNSTEVINIRHIENDQYEITVPPLLAYKTTNREN